MDSSSPEWVPTVLAWLFLVFSLAFGASVLVVQAARHYLRKADGGNPSPSKSKSTQTFEDLDGSLSSDGSPEPSPPTGTTGTEQVPVTLVSWSNLSCSYPSKNSGNSVVTLKDAFGVLRTGELTAIMGPSGAGKSTLLDILGGRKTLGVVTGDMSVFGQNIFGNNANKEMDMKQASLLLRRDTAFVPQELAFFPMQTPEEAVRFVARLQHGPNCDLSSTQQAHALLQEVGLKKSLYARPIGGALAGGITVRGLSGGERKRLALACALVMKPKLLLLDEITSGLDSDNAHATMLLVKRVCTTHNVSAAVVIHQPNGYIFETFDRLVLLSSGRCVFSNTRANLTHLYEKGFKQTMPSSNHELPLDLLSRLRRFHPSKDDYQPLHSDTFDGDVECPATTGNNSQNAIQQMSSRPAAHVPFLYKLLVVFERSLTTHYVRNHTNMTARLAFYGLCAMLCGALFWKVGENEDQILIGAFTFLMLSSYLLPFTCISIFVHEKQFFLCEQELGLYSPWIYCISQGLLELWLISLASTIQAAVAIPMCAFWNPGLENWVSFLTMLSVIIASGLVGSALVLFFSVVMPSQDLVFLSAAGTVTFTLGLSGGFVPFTAIEDSISWLQWVSPCKYSLQGLTIGFFQGTRGEAIVEAFQLDRPSTVTSNIAILFLFYAVLAVGTMYALSRQRVAR